MTPRLLPLARHPVVHTKSLEEARVLYSRLTAPIQLERIERALPFEWRANLVVVGSIAISTNWLGGGSRGSTESVGEIFSLVFPMSAAGGEAAQCGTTVPLIRGQTGFVASPLLPTDIRMEPDYQSIQVMAARADMEAALDALTGTTRRRPLQFEPRLSTTSGAGAAVLHLVRFLIAEVDRDEGFLDSPPIVARFADIILYKLLSEQPHNHSGLLRTPARAAEPQYIRKVAEYLDANAAEPVRLAELVAVAGVSIRSIQAGFRAHRGCSPLEFLRERRFALARTLLLRASGSTVTEIAQDCGFEHLGRFSVQYRARFGESPADTLRRTRGPAENGG